MFYNLINFDFDSFEQFSNIELLDVSKGRKGRILVDVVDDKVPIIRSTTKFNKSSLRFNKYHYLLIDKIKEKIKENDFFKEISFNNALIEIYDDNYSKMGFHSDQSIDLNDDSYICLFSCYKNIDKPSRKFIYKEKQEPSFEKEILLENNSLIIFSTNTNLKYLHKIILNSKNGNEWLGITLRLSKNLIKIPIGDQLKLANHEETLNFYKNKKIENEKGIEGIENEKGIEKQLTISPGDLIDP